MDNYFFLNKKFNIKIITLEKAFLFYGEATILDYNEKQVIFKDSKTDLIKIFPIDQIKDIQEVKNDN